MSKTLTTDILRCWNYGCFPTFSIFFFLLSQHLFIFRIKKIITLSLYTILVFFKGKDKEARKSIEEFILVAKSLRSEFKPPGFEPWFPKLLCDFGQIF